MPSITTWNRVEPRSRSTDLTAGLEARVHDPLWFLTRQWQVGEFQGRDTGSPVQAQLQASIAVFDRYSVAGATAQAYAQGGPIEVLVEQEAVRPAKDGDDFRQAAEAGLYLARLLAAAKVPASVLALYLAQYPLVVSAGNAQLISSIVAGRVVDGIKLYSDLAAAGANLPSTPMIPADQHAAVLAATRDWLTWYGSLFNEPGKTDGWSPDRMEYSFAMGVAGGGDSYTAQEYDGGAVEWYSFDRSVKSMGVGSAQPTTSTGSFVATPVTYRAMPARRFWEMEDAGTNIGQLSAGPEDLGRLLLREFALIYGSDWFQFPLVVPVGSEVQITSLSVADTFGVITAIPHYSAVDGPLAKWRMFEITPDPLDPQTATTSAATTHPLLVTPGAVAPIDGQPIEEVLMLRDEVANMAWGIERTVPGVSGQSFDRTTAWNTSLPATPPPSDSGLVEYRLGSDVPDYWLPFIPVRTGGTGVLKLQRGKLPTSLTGPLGKMLGYANMALFPEEVPRAGVLLTRRYRLARGQDGSAYLWIGRLRSIGEGEGQSCLEFDFLE